MESALSSDDSCDSEAKLKTELTEFGLNDDSICKEEMCNLLKALRDSQQSAIAKESEKAQIEESSCSTSPKKNLKRRYINVRDRRMPWSLLPSTISQAEKARSLAVYIKLMSINNYRQARQSPNFATWPPPIQIVEESARVQPLRSTRSGRSVPIYAGFDDDSSDLDFVITKTKKRKISSSEQNTGDGDYSHKVFSLKRKTSKDENTRPFKEAKMNSENNMESVTSGNNIKLKKEVLIIED